MVAVLTAKAKPIIRVETLPTSRTYGVTPAPSACATNER
jgi:hypothetical protein